MIEQKDSIFREIYSPQKFIDRFASDPSNAMDVIIPIIHTNELWEANLHSLYREIPIKRLLISDGGCVDNSIEIVKKFPRVVIFDHSKYKSLGFCIRKLIESVETEWFIYPHSDVYLPPQWFDKMAQHRTNFDWFGCPMQHMVLVEYPMGPTSRPFAGTQMGRKEAFIKNLHRIDDDYVYRQEDYVFERVVEDSGYKCGKITDTFHYHQTMYKPSPWGRKVRDVKIDFDLAANEEARVSETQARGIVKYLRPDSKLANVVMVYLAQYIASGQTDLPTFLNWTKEVNPDWIPHIKRWKVNLLILLKKNFMKQFLNRILRIVQLT